MREILLIAIIVTLSGVALFRPKVGILAYVWFSLMRPDLLAWSGGGFPYSPMLALSTMAGAVRYMNRFPGVLTNTVTRRMLMLAGIFFASIFFAVEPWLSFNSFQQFMRMFVMVILIFPCTADLDDLRRLLLTMAASLGFLGLKFGAYGLINGGARYDMGPGGLLSDNNDMALAMAMTFPLCWYARSLVSSRWMRLLFLAMMLGCASTVVMTHSRGGALSLGVVLLLTAWRSGKKLTSIAMVVLCVAPAIYLVRTSYMERLSTLADPELEDSARSRLDYYAAALKIGADYPILGLGFGGHGYMRVQGRYLDNAKQQVVHNTYLQLLVDTGVLSLLLYVTILFGAIRTLGSSARAVRHRNPGAEVYPYAIQAALIAYAVGCTFLSRINFDFTYMLLVAAGCWYALQPREAADSEPVFAEAACAS